MTEGNGINGGNGKIVEMEGQVDVMLDRIPVTLGGQTRYLRRMPLGETRQWRERFGAFLAPLLEGALGSGAVIGTAAGAALDYGKVLRSVFPYLMGEGVDSLVEMVPLYDPAIAEAYGAAKDLERVEVAVRILEEMLPFVEKMLAIQARMMGQMRE